VTEPAIGALLVPSAVCNLLSGGPAMTDVPAIRPSPTTRARDARQRAGRTPPVLGPRRPRRIARLPRQLPRTPVLAVHGDRTAALTAELRGEGSRPRRRRWARRSGS